MAADFPGFSSPAAGFEVPLEMLAACHLRIDRQLVTLQRLAAHLPRHGSDAEASGAASAVMHYFDSAAGHHHADEEIDLFPALIESMAGSDAVCLRELVATLTADHRALEAQWRHLRPSLALLAAGQAASLDALAVDTFVDHYRRHIAREDAELLPMAGRLLADADLDRVGLAMRRRRGIALTQGE